MNRIQIEKAQDCTSEYFVFTLNCADGTRYYGFCYRHLFRGIARRFDVGRRTRHCLCIISRYPYFEFFKSLLMHIYGVALLERYLGQCKAYTQGLLAALGEMITHHIIGHHPILEPGFFVSTSPLSATVQKLVQPVYWTLPRPGRAAYRDVTLLPLFETLGVDKFFKVFSAALCEKRILFVADDINALSTVVLSAAAMLHPFIWKHMFITVLPHKLLTLVSSSGPYLMGVKKQSFGALKREQLDGIMVVDLDRGDVTVHGDFPEKDLIGDAGNALKQASEGLDRMRQGISSVFLGKNETDNSSNSAQRDIMAMLLLDLRSALASKPGSSSIQSVASGLLRGLPGNAKSVAESKAQWALEGEKALRDALACFFVFLFADLDDFLLSNNSNDITTVSQSTRTHNEVRSRFDLRGFIARKRTNGASKLLVDFLMEFLHAQMFEDYCASRFTRAHRSSTSTSMSSGSADYDDLFSAASLELINRSLPNTASNAKQAVLARSSSLAVGDAGVGDQMASNKINTGQFHTHTLHFTGSSQGQGAADIDLMLSSSFYSPPADSPANTLLERIIADSYHVNHQRKIFAALQYRLQTARSANCKGSAGLAGCKALYLLQVLLVQGQLSAVANALDLLPLLRSLLKVNPQKAASNAFTAGVDTFLPTQVFDPRLPAWTVFELLVDHKKLLVQRLHHTVTKSVVKAAAPSKLDLLSFTEGSRRFPAFADLHQALRAGQKSVEAGHLKCSEPERMRDREEGQEDGEEAVTSTTSTYRSSSSPAASSTSSVVKESTGSGRLTAPVARSEPTTGKFTVHMRAVTPPPPASALPAAEVNLLDLDGVLLDPNAKYRALNKDTGDVLDLRQPLPFSYTTQTSISSSSGSGGSSAGVGLLKPPPNDKGPRRKPAGSSAAALPSPTTPPAGSNKQVQQQAAPTSSFDFLDLFSSPPATTAPPVAAASTNSGWLSPPPNPFAAFAGNGQPQQQPAYLTHRPQSGPGAGLPAPRPAASKDPFASLVDFK